MSDNKTSGSSGDGVPSSSTGSKQTLLTGTDDGRKRGREEDGESPPRKKQTLDITKLAGSQNVPSAPTSGGGTKDTLIGNMTVKPTSVQQLKLMIAEIVKGDKFEFSDVLDAIKLCPTNVISGITPDTFGLIKRSHISRFEEDLVLSDPSNNARTDRHYESYIVSTRGWKSSPEFLKSIIHQAGKILDLIQTCSKQKTPITHQNLEMVLSAAMVYHKYGLDVVDTNNSWFQVISTDDANSRYLYTVFDGNCAGQSDSHTFMPRVFNELSEFLMWNWRRGTPVLLVNVNPTYNKRTSPHSEFIDTWNELNKLVTSPETSIGFVCAILLKALVEPVFTRADSRYVGKPRSMRSGSTLDY